MKREVIRKVHLEIPQISLQNVKLPINDIKNSFEKAGNKIGNLINDSNRMEGLLEEAEQLIRMIPGISKFSFIPPMIAMFKDYYSGEYTHVRKWTIIVGAVVLAYVVSPLDLVPDVLPVIGKLDDATILSIAWMFVRDDVKKYQMWQRMNHMRVYA